MNGRRLDRRGFVRLAAAAGAAVLLGGSALGCSAASPSQSPSPSSKTGEQGDVSGDVGAAQSADASPHAFNVPDKQLPSGFAMPALGIGTWTLADDVAEASVYHALTCGYRLVDTAQYYGNEAGVGRAVARADADGVAARGDVFVTTKVMPSNFALAAESVDGSLERLGLDYIDLVLIHQPGTDDLGVWRTLEQAVRDGKVRSIGISNYYTPEHFDTIASAAELPVSVLQNENHPYYQNNALRDYISIYGTAAESWYPLGGRPGIGRLLADEVVQGVAERNGVSSALAVLRWHLQSGYVAIPGSSDPAHIEENARALDFELGEADMAALAALDGTGRFENW